ncbi:MAG: hypothetical protein H0T84_09100, partial [Tatlockia sp.]|nr:hypothetical protein [Tatlockia sp.]
NTSPIINTYTTSPTTNYGIDSGNGPSGSGINTDTNINNGAGSENGVNSGIGENNAAGGGSGE